MPAQSRVAPWLMSAWQRRGALAWILSPLALTYAAIVKVRRIAYANGILKASRAMAPVVVLGNLYVGGTGKTPLAIALVRALRQHGFQPGVISRGYGGTARSARVVSEGDTAAEVGDEPLLIAESTGAPVAVGARRAQAAALLLQAHPACDVLIADDGLQHLALARDLEVALIDERGLGNGWVLPAGPLREPPARLARVDAIVLHGTAAPPVQGVPNFPLRTQLADHAYRLADRSQFRPLVDFAQRQRSTGLRITAAAGIGVPQRFFDMLTAIGLRVDPLPLPDHFEYRVNPFAGCDTDVVLITEKDAVKCRRSDALRDDTRLWVVPLDAQVDTALVDLVIARLKLLRKTPHGFPAS